MLRWFREQYLTNGAVWCRRCVLDLLFHQKARSDWKSIFKTRGIASLKPSTSFSNHIFFDFFLLRINNSHRATLRIFLLKPCFYYRHCPKNQSFNNRPSLSGRAPFDYLMFTMIYPTATCMADDDQVGGGLWSLIFGEVVGWSLTFRWIQKSWREFEELEFVGWSMKGLVVYSLIFRKIVVWSFTEL